MKIVLPWVKIVSERTQFGCEELKLMDEDEGVNLVRKIEFMSRISHRAEEAQTPESYKRFIPFVVKEKGDYSVVEHAPLTVLMYHDRGIQQEKTRHRPPAYTIESTRFVNYEKKMSPSFIYPDPKVECHICLSGQEPAWNNNGETDWYHADGSLCCYEKWWVDSVKQSEASYKGLITKGWRPQEARSVFPLCLGSLMAVTTNLRQWRHEMLMRTTLETHPSFRQISIPLLNELKRVIPIIFDDIEPLAKQSVNLKKMR